MIAALALAFVLPGMFAPASSAHTVGVEALDPGAAPAATEIWRQLSASGYEAVPVEADPAASDCAAKPYAAAARVDTTTFHGESGWTFDVGLVLVDCAGWPVDEWHCYTTLSLPPDDADAEKLGMALSLRFRTWMHTDTARADSLFRTGLAYDPAGERATYLYRLFRTDDGNMRAYVRPGGPAFAAGLRTNDVVGKIDGKYWWDYGTYQAQQRAYDGKPHTFEIMRGKERLTVSLGLPYIASGK